MKPLPPLPYTHLTTRTGTKRGLVIIAGEMREYKIFLEEHGLPVDRDTYLFISDPTRLRSMQGVTILCVGNYRKSPIMQYPYVTRAQRLHKIRFVDTNGDEVRT